MCVLSLSACCVKIAEMLYFLLPHQVHGAVLNVCCRNPFHQEIFVDTWPNFQVVIARPQREVYLGMGDARPQKD